MKKFALVILISALLAVGVANAQTTGDQIINRSKKVAKTTGKGVKKGYRVGKNTVIKGTKMTTRKLKKIFH